MVTDDQVISVLAAPLASWQIRNGSVDGWIEGVICVELSEVVECPDLDAFLNLIGEKLAGFGECLMSHEYTVVGNQGNTLILRIKADARGIIAEMEEATELCQNCGNQYTEDELTNPIPDLCQRVSPGEIMPSGECPEPQCGALCHPIKEV